jgi:molecular chaperone GrpE (heat shock protein)
MHALKYARQQELKAVRQQKVSVGKEAESIGCTYDAQRCEWTKAHEEHVRVEQQAYALSEKLEAVEKDKDLQRRRAQQHRDELTRFACCRLVRRPRHLPLYPQLLTARVGALLVRFAKMHEQLKRELGIIQASAQAV